MVMRSKSVKLAIPEAPVCQSTMNESQGRLCRIYDRNVVCGARLSLYGRIHSTFTDFASSHRHARRLNDCRTNVPMQLLPGTSSEPSPFKEMACAPDCQHLKQDEPDTLEKSGMKYAWAEPAQLAP